MVENILTELSWIDVFDMALVSLLIYALLTIVRQTHTQFIATGFLGAAGIYLVSLTAGLQLTASIFHVFFTVIVVVIMILFQDEMRTLFERFATLLLQRPFGSRRLNRLNPTMRDALVHALTEFTEKNIGALIVFQGNDPLNRYTHGGTQLDAKISEPILKSIFDPHSLGHDGALIIVGDRLERFMCHLRLSTNQTLLKRRGTRHAAVLGLSEDSDALCLVVSEERGSISVARHGQLIEVENEDVLHALLDDFERENVPQPPRSWKQIFLTADLNLKFFSIAVSFILWFFLVFESNIEYRSFIVPVQYTGLEPHLKFVNIKPSEVRVVVSAPRRSFYFIHAKDFPVTLRLFDVEAGSSEITLVASDVNLPDGVIFENIWPRTVRVDIKQQMP